MHLHVSWSDLNVWAILITAVIAMVIGGLWYSPVLFGNLWMKLIDLKKEELRSPTGPMIGAVLMNILSSLLLAMFIQISGATMWCDGLLIGALLSLVVGAKIATNYFFEGKSLQLFLLTYGYHAIPLLIGGWLLAVWR